MKRPLYIKICGLTLADQAVAVAAMGISAIGFICVPESPRFRPPHVFRDISRQLPRNVERVGVFRNATLTQIGEWVEEVKFTALQLHGEETPALCRQLKAHLPEIKQIKAFRIDKQATLETIWAYVDIVDQVLLDSYHPSLAGGTGQTFHWPLLKSFSCPIPWILAGGLTPENIEQALGSLDPDGIDVSSGVEISPGNKDLALVQQLVQNSQYPGSFRNKPPGSFRNKPLL
jgi:phosphoribosylanthranilate isomerase